MIRSDPWHHQLPRNFTTTPPREANIMSITQVLRSFLSQASSVRIPLRWRWALLVGTAVALSIVIFTLMVLDMERKAWEQSKEAQAILLVDRLADEIKLPMLSGNRAQVQLLLDRFVDKIPDAAAVHLRWRDNRIEQVGSIPLPEALSGSAARHEQTARLSQDGLWFGRGISYAEAELGAIAVAFSDDTWQQLAREMTEKLLLSSLLVLLATMVAVFWLAGRMSRPMELLAQGSQLVASGDFTIRLPAHANDEIGDAMREFNRMVEELEHKSRMRDDLGRYLNPELIDSVFDQRKQGPESERREVTILFADMVEFTSFSQHADTGAVVATLNRYFGLFNSVITHFDGHVDKFIGDAVMAVFNHPHPHEEHPLQAALAALAMIECCRRLRYKRPGDHREVAFRIGINRGEVIVGNIGTRERLEFTVIGDAVNVASRMEGLGGGNQLVASATSFEGFDHAFSLQDLGEKKVKGVSSPLRCVAVTTEDETLLAQIREAVDAAFCAQFGPNYEEQLADD